MNSASPALSRSCDNTMARDFNLEERQLYGVRCKKFSPVKRLKSPSNETILWLVSIAKAAK